MKIKISEIRKRLEKTLRDKRVRATEARVIADEYLEGELQGKVSHGLMAFPSLGEGLGDKKLKKIKIVKQMKAMVIIDAQ